MTRWRTPDALRTWLRARYVRNAGGWMLGEGGWPLCVPLGSPTEALARTQWDLFEAWLRQWHGQAGVDYVEKRWPGLGVQRLPAHARFEDARAVAQALGEDESFARAQQRSAHLLMRWPLLRPALCKQFDLLANAPDAEFERLVAVFDWLLAHPGSQLYPRQLPIAGIDSKWLEGARQCSLRDWLQAHRGEASSGAADNDLVQLAGLRAVPGRAHLRVLDPGLRAALGGLGDVNAPVQDLACLRWTALRRVFVVENQQTGLAFGDVPGSVLLIGRGYAVDTLERLPWLHDVPLHYWGDIDTHGFAILDRLRRHLPQAQSLLMDEATLLQHRAVWGEEPKPHTASNLPALTHEEARLYADLCQGRWAPRLRLEQERIGWDRAWSAIVARAAA